MRKRAEVELEVLRADHAKPMFAGMADARGYVFIPLEPPADLDALTARFAWLASGAPPGRGERWRNWAVRDRGSLALVGWTQATIVGREATVAYGVFPAEWRRGIATAAMRSTAAVLFRDEGVDVLRALVDTRNNASIALLARLGFRRTRTIRDADWFKGATSHEHEYALERR